MPPKLYSHYVNMDMGDGRSLGVGGLLFDACRLCQLLGQENRRELRLLEDVMQGSVTA